MHMVTNINDRENQSYFDVTHLGRTLFGLSFIGGGRPGLLMDGSLTLVGGLLRRSFPSGFSSEKHY